MTAFFSSPFLHLSLLEQQASGWQGEVEIQQARKYLHVTYILQNQVGKAKGLKVISAETKIKFKGWVWMKEKLMSINLM